MLADEYETFAVRASLTRSCSEFMGESVDTTSKVGNTVMRDNDTKSFRRSGLGLFKRMGWTINVEAVDSRV